MHSDKRPIIALLFRYSSLAALIAATLTPVYSWLILQNVNVLICHGVIAALLIWRHQSNIRKLISGTEDKIEAFIQIIQPFCEPVQGQVQVDDDTVGF